MISERDWSRGSVWEGVGGLAPNNNAEKNLCKTKHIWVFFFPSSLSSDRLYRLLLLLLKLYYKIYVIGQDPD